MDKQHRKTGGRAKGTPNKATVEREQEAARALDKSRMSGRPLAKDRLDELMDVAIGAMQRHQPVTKDMVARARAAGNKAVKESRGDWKGFGDWWDRAAFAAKSLAPFQSPTYRAIVVAQAGEGSAPAPMKDVTPEAGPAGDAATERAQQTYLRLVKG
jgi:hypothetical protein